MRIKLAVAALFVGIVTTQSADAQTTRDPVTRGRYLIRISGCNDCHTPGVFLGKPQAGRELAGSDVGFAIQGVGTVVGPNLTPDRETGLGKWTDEEIAAALRGGVRPDGRVLSPIMPYAALASLSAEDTAAIIAYLRQLPSVRHRVPAPTSADGPSSFFTWKLTPPSLNRQ